MSLPKPYERRFFSKISYHPLFPKMDTDRDGVPDFKDCKPFDPTKQHEEPVNLIRRIFPKTITID